MPAQIAPDTSQFDFSEDEIEVLLAALTGRLDDVDADAAWVIWNRLMDWMESRQA